MKANYSPFTSCEYNNLVNYYATIDTLSLDEIWDEVFEKFNDEDLANDVVEEIKDLRDDGEAWYSYE